MTYPSPNRQDYYYYYYYYYYYFYYYYYYYYYYYHYYIIVTPQHLLWIQYLLEPVSTLNASCLKPIRLWQFIEGKRVSVDQNDDPY